MLSTEWHAWGAAQVGKVCAHFGRELRSKINSRVVASSSYILAREPGRQALLGGNSPFHEERGFVRDQLSHNARVQEPVGRRQGSAGVSTSYSWRRGRLHFNLGLSLAASPARLRVSPGRTALRSVALSAMRPHRGVAPGIPVCPPREHVPPRPLRRIALWSVLARGQNDPAAPSVFRVRSGRLPARVGQTYRQNTHT